LNLKTPALHLDFLIFTPSNRHLLQLLHVSSKDGGWDKQNNRLGDAMVFVVMKNKMYRLKRYCLDYRKPKGRETGRGKAPADSFSHVVAT
jgi:hypothetical protein